TVLLLNTNYNDALPQYKTLNYVPSTAELQLINNSNVEGYLKFVSTQTNALRRKICDFFSSVDENIYSLMNEIGSLSLDDLLRIHIGDNYREIMGIEKDIEDLRKFVQENK